MSAKASKLVRLYVGLRAREGAPVLLQDMKRRVAALTDLERSRVYAMMEAYCAGRDRSARRERPLIRKEEDKRTDLGNILHAIGAMLGLGGKS